VQRKVRSQPDYENKGFQPISSKYNLLNDEMYAKKLLLLTKARCSCRLSLLIPYVLKQDKRAHCLNAVACSPALVT